MKILRLFALGFLTVVMTLSALSAEAYVSVKGYYRSDGTYVAPHVRSNPNGLKYDNYGYKPSQGLYNETYGTRGSEWDTPTYITDPDYYEGNAIYDAQNGSGISSSNYFQIGSSNSDVIDIQTKLAQDSSIYPEGTISGYYGSLTEEAVKRFQTKYGIINYGTPNTTGYGVVGPKTRAKINEIFGGTDNSLLNTNPISVTAISNTEPSKTIVPANATVYDYNAQGWTCNSGFKQQGSSCSKTIVPANATVYDYNAQGWTCNSGFKQQGSSCI
jgi:peptidoglycan hydrolase-like protein with peptidoglycan-binding domain